MDIDLTPALKLKMASRTRTRGRYNSSELYAITHGWVTPEDWLHPKDKEVEDILNMWAGTGLHNQLEDLMGKKYSEEKKVFSYKDINLVGKVDFLPPNNPNEVWEFKTSKNLMRTMKPWAEHQIKLYTTMFEKDIGKVYQPVQNKEGIFLKDIGTVNRDDRWFDLEMAKLYEFHEKVEKLWVA